MSALADSTPIKRRARRRACVPNLDDLPDNALITREQLSLAANVSISSLKRYEKAGRGPEVVRIEGLPRYRVGKARTWMRG